MKFNKIRKIILFGGSLLLVELAKYIKKDLSFELVVFSSKRHLDEVIDDKKTLKEILDKNNIKYYNSDDINHDKNLDKEISKNALGIAFGAAWVFEESTVNLFTKNHLLDFMGIDLPRYRGGAHSTWQILHQNNKACSNLQIIHGDVETFHRGEIIKREAYELPLELKKPIDHFIFIQKRQLDFLKEFITEIQKDKDFELKILDEKQSSYYPFLFTKINGLIDWNWGGKDIYLFINAFDDPYAGASTYLNNKKVFLKDCELIKAQENYHPFTSGIVIRKNEEGIFIAVQGNLLLIKKVFDENDINIIDSIKLGDRFYTPHSELDKARGFKAEYTSRGLKGEKNE